MLSVSLEENSDLDLEGKIEKDLENEGTRRWENYIRVGGMEQMNVWKLLYLQALFLVPSRT